MSAEKTFAQKINDLLEEVRQLEDDFDERVIKETAARLKGLNFSPPVITPIDTFLQMRRKGLWKEIDRLLALPDSEACALAPDDGKKCADLRVQLITVLIFYYKKLLRLRTGNPEEWEEVDELYVHD